MFRFQLNLKQVTPYLHFQGNSMVETDAMLRGSEIKTRLDRFIWTYYKDEMKKLIDETKDIRRILVDPKHERKALNYKVRVELAPGVELSTESTTCEKIGKKKRSFYPSYFGGTAKYGEDEKKRLEAASECFLTETTDFQSTVIVSFSGFDTTVEALLMKVSPVFFAVSTFGKRKTKGFGSFTPITLTTKKETVIEFYSDEFIREAIEQIAPCYIKISFDKSESNSDNIFRYSYVIYQMLKSGINHGRYYQSFLMKKYMFQKNIGNEKYKIKNSLLTKEELKLLEKKERKPIRHFKDKEIRYTRAMLGITDHIEFRSEKLSEITVKYTSAMGENDKIYRFASPLLLKTINGQLYIFPRFTEMPKQIFDHPFRIERLKKDDMPEVHMRTPKSEEFNLQKLLEQFSDELRSFIKRKEGTSTHASSDIHFANLPFLIKDVQFKSRSTKI
ncbi:MAG: hypothetical protein K0R57_1070 [Paenibacillaceae bacterium]|jgi:hypothetical protein|nr:hypothetical protein [Paenibacillaceae bacterium]